MTRDATNTATETAVNVKFDNVAFSAAIAELIQAKADHKSATDAGKRKVSALELKALLPAIEHGAATFDLQPLARFVSDAKPSAIAKRAIQAVFPSHQFILIGDKKRPGFAVMEGKAKVADAKYLDILQSAYATNEGFTSDSVKAAFPAPKLNKDEKADKLRDTLAKRLKADGLTKADLLAMLADI